MIDGVTPVNGNSRNIKNNMILKYFTKIITISQNVVRDGRGNGEELRRSEGTRENLKKTRRADHLGTSFESIIVRI